MDVSNEPEQHHVAAAGGSCFAHPLHLVVDQMAASADTRQGAWHKGPKCDRIGTYSAASNVKIPAIGT
jgi:hypothetical protein